MNRKYNSMYERLIANSEKPDDQNENGCWLWTGRTDGKPRTGLYGRMNVRINGEHKTVAPHRVMHEEIHDVKLGEDETIDHLCGNTLCINPNHWEDPVTRVENSRLSQERNPRTPSK